MGPCWWAARGSLQASTANPQKQVRSLYLSAQHCSTAACQTAHLTPLRMCAVISSILRRAACFLPGLQLGQLAEAAVPRVGLRPYCKQGQPLLGPVPGLRGLWVAAGHEGSGLTLAPVSADIMARQLLGLATDQLCSAFLPAALL